MAKQCKLCEATDDKPRPCTCHPDDNPPKPCAEKYALSECKDAPRVVQEWTPEWLVNYGSAENWLREICDAHNTELAAAREEGVQLRQERQPRWWW